MCGSFLTTRMFSFFTETIVLENRRNTKQRNFVYLPPEMKVFAKNDPKANFQTVLIFPHIVVFIAVFPSLNM